MNNCLNNLTLTPGKHDAFLLQRSEVRVCASQWISLFDSYDNARENKKFSLSEYTYDNKRITKYLLEKKNQKNAEALNV